MIIIKLSIMVTSRGEVWDVIWERNKRGFSGTDMFYFFTWVTQMLLYNYL